MTMTQASAHRSFYQQQREHRRKEDVDAVETSSNNEELFLDEDNHSYEVVAPYRGKHFYAGKSVAPAPSSAASPTTSSTHCSPDAEVHKLGNIPRPPSRPTNKPGGDVHSSWCCCIYFLAVAGIGMAVIYFVVLGGDSDKIPEFSGFFDVDPFEPTSPENATRWSNSGNGLDIEVVNALDTQWYTHFEKSILDWDSGYPDALSLTTSVRSPDTECLQESGLIKVCNGNYGQTPWKGQAEILEDMITNRIVSVVARLNDAYLSPRNTNEMQYAMCHELGHAFGLHHTDENFWNRNLGNCMDYTQRYRDSLTPDSSNFEFLHALYGLVPGAASFTAPTSAPVSVPTTTQSGSGGNDFSGTGSGTNGGTNSEEENNGNSNGRWPANEETDNQQEENNNDNNERMVKEIPDWLDDAMREARELTLQGEEQSIPLPGGYLLRIHQLKVDG